MGNHGKIFETCWHIIVEHPDFFDALIHVFGGANPRQWNPH